MNKLITKKKVILTSIVLFIIIGTLIVFFLRKNTYSIKQLKMVNTDSGCIVKEIDLGKYIPMKNYNEYLPYILTNNSDFNVLKTLGMEIKYPKFLKPNLISKNSSVYLSNEDSTVTLTIKQKENTKHETIEDIINGHKEMMSCNKNSLQDWKFKYDTYKDKAIIRCDDPTKKSGSYMIFVVTKNKIYIASLTHIQPQDNIEEIINTMKDSFKIKKQ